MGDLRRPIGQAAAIVAAEAGGDAGQGQRALQRPGFLRLRRGNVCGEEISFP